MAGCLGVEPSPADLEAAVLPKHLQPERGWLAGRPHLPQESDPWVDVSDAGVDFSDAPFVSQAKFTSIGTELNRQPPVYKTGVLPLNYRCVAKGLSRAFADGGLRRIPTRPVRTGVLGSVSPLASLPRFGHGATILRPDLA